MVLPRLLSSAASYPNLLLAWLRSPQVKESRHITQRHLWPEGASDPPKGQMVFSTLLSRLLEHRPLLEFPSLFTCNSRVNGPPYVSPRACPGLLLLQWLLPSCAQWLHTWGILGDHTARPSGTCLHIPPFQHFPTFEQYLSRGAQLSVC